MISVRTASFSSISRSSRGLTRICLSLFTSMMSIYLYSSSISLVSLNRIDILLLLVCSFEKPTSEKSSLK